LTFPCPGIRDQRIAVQGWRRRPALDRLCLTDVQWDKIADLLPGKPGDPGRSGADNRLFVEAVLWIARTGAPWRDLPASFGNWNSVFQRFRRWTLKGVFERMFKALRGDPDFEYVIADGTISRVHQKASGAKGSLSAKPLGARAAA
jgi:transposase